MRLEPRRLVLVDVERLFLAEAFVRDQFHLDVFLWFAVVAVLLLRLDADLV